MRREEPDRIQRETAGSEMVQDDREPPRRSADLDAIAGHVLGHPKRARAVREQGPETVGGMERRPPVQSGEVGDQLHRRLALLARELLQPREELAISE